MSNCCVALLLTHTLSLCWLRHTQAVPGMALSEGAGVQIRRTVGTPALRNLDPFLMLDELKLPVDQATAGFPDHPHR